MISPGPTAHERAKSKPGAFSQFSYPTTLRRCSTAVMSQVGRLAIVVLFLIVGGFIQLFDFMQNLGREDRRFWFAVMVVTKGSRETNIRILKRVDHVPGQRCLPEVP